MSNEATEAGAGDFWADSLGCRLEPSLHPKCSVACTLQTMIPSFVGKLDVTITPTGTFLWEHVGWDVFTAPRADGSQTGVKLSPQAIFEEGVMETKWRWQWTTPARGALDEIPHLKVAHV